MLISIHPVSVPLLTRAIFITVIACARYLPTTSAQEITPAHAGPSCSTGSSTLPTSARAQGELTSLMNRVADASRRSRGVHWACHYENPYTPLSSIGRQLGWSANSVTQESCTLDRAQVGQTITSRFYSSQEDLDAMSRGGYPYSRLAAFSGDWACNATQEVVDRDSHRSCRPSPELFRRPFPSMALRRIQGTLNYVGVWPAPFSYDLETLPDGRLKVKARIRFTRNGRTSDVSAAQLETMRRGLQEAAKVWSQSSPNQDIVYDFDIDQSSEESANLTVNLETGRTRGPYYSNWTTEWSSAVIAHEMGHVMGLDDEYHQMRNTARGSGFGPFVCRMIWGTSENPIIRDECDPTSLMCDPHAAGNVPQPYHHYLIARRLACADQPIDESCIPPHIEDRASETRGLIPN